MLTVKSTSHGSASPSRPEEIQCRFGGPSARRHILEESFGSTEGRARGSRQQDNEYVPNVEKVLLTN